MPSDDEWRQYELVEGRRNSHDQMIWQVPAIALTAEAFLFTIALSSTSSELARIVSMLLAMMLSFLSVHLMVRNRTYTALERAWLEQFEIDHALPMNRARLTETTVIGSRRSSWFVDSSATRWWVGGLWTITATSAFVLLVAVVRPSLLGT